MEKMDLEKLAPILSKRWRAWASQPNMDPSKYIFFHVMLEDVHGIKIDEEHAYYKNWKNKTYEIVDEKKYVDFILRWS